MFFLVVFYVTIFAGTTLFSAMMNVNAQLDKLQKLSCLLGFFARSQFLLEHTCLDKSSRIPKG